MITSDEGIQQGDPLGPLEFCLTLHPLLKRLSSELIVAYINDVTIGGDINSVIDDLRTILQTSKQAYGPSLCIKKCEITALEKATVENVPETRESTFTPLSDLTLLGAPVTTGAVAVLSRDSNGHCPPPPQFNGLPPPAVVLPQFFA